MRKLLCVTAALALTASLAFAAPAAAKAADKKTTTATATTTTAGKSADKKAATAPASTKAADKKEADKKAAVKKDSGPAMAKPYVDAGDIVTNVGIGYAGYYGGYGLAGGLEYDFAKINAGGLPITFGAAARGAFEFGGYIDTVWCVGAMGTAHLGLRGIKIPTTYGWASNFDTYIGIGLGYAGGQDSYWTVSPKLGPAFLVGETYYFNDKLGVNLEYGYIGQYGYNGYYYTYSEPAYYASLGLVLKL
jgi:hypothetical protein